MSRRNRNASNETNETKNENEIINETSEETKIMIDFNLINSINTINPLMTENGFILFINNSAALLVDLIRKGRRGMTVKEIHAHLTSLGQNVTEENINETLSANPEIFPEVAKPGSRGRAKGFTINADAIKARFQNTEE